MAGFLYNIMYNIYIAEQTKIVIPFPVKRPVLKGIPAGFYYIVRAEITAGDGVAGLSLSLGGGLLDFLARSPRGSPCSARRRPGAIPAGCVLLL